MGERALDDLLAPCGHAEPQAAHQLHGVCIFCWRNRASALATALSSATAEIERLKADNERLDWMERDWCMVYPSLDETAKTPEFEHWVAVVESRADRRGWPKPTLREAIDAARKESP